VGLFLGILILGVLSFVAFWKPNAVSFMLTGGLSIMVGLYAPDTLRMSFGAGIGLIFILYSFVCLGFGYAFLFMNTGEE
jgi:hypothetical protein